MLTYYKYLPISQEDISWGICTLDAGKGRISLYDKYPCTDHPKQYYFNWNEGRVLNEYQVIYITRGEGVFESKSCPPIRIREGTIIMLFPREWHRYKPDKQTGWDEYWVGFKGVIIDNLVKNGFLSPETPAFKIGLNEEVLNIFLEIIESTKNDTKAYQPLMSGALFHLLGLIHSNKNEKFVEGKSMSELIVEKALLILKGNVDEELYMEKVAHDLHVSYSRFRKMFKAYTGVAPGQYMIQLKIDKAKKLLADPTRSIKEIAYELNFKSSFDFSKLFKKKASVSPEVYRKQLLSNLQKIGDREGISATG